MTATKRPSSLARPASGGQRPRAQIPTALQCHPFVPWGLLLAACLTGCASGPRFREVPRLSVPPDKALLYIYRPAAFVGGGGTEELRVNSQHLGNIHNGGFLAYLAAPGRLDFTARLRPEFGTLLLAPLRPECELLTLDAAPGQTYYLRFWHSTTWGIFDPKMELVDHDTGAREISECRARP